MTRNLQQKSHQKPPKPKKVKQCFDVGVLAWRHPIRLISWALTLSFLFPDLSWLVGKIFGTDEGLSGLILIFITFMLFFGLPLLTYFVEYKKFPILLFEDRIEFRENIFLSENYRIAYRNVLEVKIKSNPLQKRKKMSTIRLNLRSGSENIKTKNYWQDFHDVKNAKRIAKFIESKI